MTRRPRTLPKARALFAQGKNADEIAAALGIERGSLMRAVWRAGDMEFREALLKSTPGKFGAGMTCGNPSTYSAGCRCDKCRAAHAARMRAYKAQRSAMTAAGHTDLPHGLGGYDNWRCRCEVCVEARREHERRAQASRVARMEAGSPDVPHGTRSGYISWGCRCDDCRHAAGYTHARKMAEATP